MKQNNLYPYIVLDAIVRKDDLDLIESSSHKADNEHYFLATERDIKNYIENYAQKNYAHKFCWQNDIFSSAYVAQVSSNFVRTISFSQIQNPCYDAKKFSHLLPGPNGNFLFSTNHESRVSLH